MDVVTLKKNAQALGVTLESDQAEKLLHYVALLERWNAHFNLVSRRDISRVWPRHVMDSLSIAPLIAQSTPTGVNRALDVGTGAGFPGLPLAIADPSVEWLLIDRNQRKIRFLETVFRELELDNVQARVLDLNGAAPAALEGWADLAVSRAVDVPAAMVKLAQPMLSPSGYLVLLTGVSREPGEDTGEDKDNVQEPVQDQKSASSWLSGFRVAAVREVAIPGLDRTHEVTIIVRDGVGTDREE